MGRGTSDQLKSNAATESGLAGGYNSNATSAFSVLSPTYTQEVNNPHGFAPEDLADMNTASQTSLGGTNAGIEGEGMLRAARTRNAGAGDAVTEEAGRSAMRQNSVNAVNVKLANAQEREKNRQAGLAGMDSLYNQNQDATLKAMGLSNDAYDKAGVQMKSGAFGSILGAGGAIGAAAIVA